MTKQNYKKVDKRTIYAKKQHKNKSQKTRAASIVEED